MKSININNIEYVPKSECIDAEISYESVIVRTHSAGVFAGLMKERNGKEVVLLKARRLWYWDGAASLSQLAVDGTNKPENCKFPCEVAEIVLTEAIEIIPLTTKAKQSIQDVPIWSK